MPQITFSSPNFPQQIPLNEGMWVVLVRGRGFDGSKNANPIWGEDGSYFRGKVRRILARHPHEVEIEVEWEHGQSNLYSLTDGNSEILPLEFAPKPKRKSSVKLDSAALDPLVLDHATKTEILAVLQQHHKRDKLFKEWGLGDTIEYGRSMTFMFHGKPGTGKTWGAHCIAKALNQELLIISAAEIQSSEPGGANRAIQNAFAAARDEGKVLFLDECDSLITQRNDVGMILASEINTLLTEIEKFEGVCILATNRIETMDEALERRVSLIVEFPFPKFAERKQIWEKMLPKKMPLEEDVNLDVLAKHKLSGGQIKNIVLQAARLAVGVDAEKVTKAHFDTAIARFNSSKDLMGNRSRYRQGNEDFGRGTGSKIKTSGSLHKFLDTDEEVEETI